MFNPSVVNYYFYRGLSRLLPLFFLASGLWAAPALAQNDLSCMDTLKKFEEDPAFKTAFSAFEELVRVPPESDGTDEALLKARWHNQVLEQAKRVLDLEGVPCEEFPLSGPGGHLKGLRILPGKGIYPINSLAAEVGEKLGVSLVYSPRELWGEPGHKTTARFNHEENTVFLPHGFIGTCAIHESVHHEILHAVLYHIFWKGLDSVFHGELRAATKDEPMWNSRFYERRMSFQELAAYPLSDRLLAIDLLNTLVGFDPSSFSPRPPKSGSTSRAKSEF